MVFAALVLRQNLSVNNGWTQLQCSRSLDFITTIVSCWDVQVDGDTTMALFCWDGSFASYQLSLDNLDLALSNLIQIVRNRTLLGSFPYVCPEPVLTKRCILYINGAKMETGWQAGRLAGNTRCFNTRPA